LAHGPSIFRCAARSMAHSFRLRPVESIGAGSSRGKRLLIGTNRDESALFIGPHPQKDPMAADLGNLLPEKFTPVFKKYREVYPQMSDEQLRIRAVTAEEYWIPTMRVVDAHLKGGGSAWVYRLDFSETGGFMRGYAFHSLDVRLVWNRPSPLADNATAEAALAHQMYQAGSPFCMGKRRWLRGYRIGRSTTPRRGRRWSSIRKIMWSRSRRRRNCGCGMGALGWARLANYSQKEDLWSPTLCAKNAQRMGHPGAESGV